MNTPAYEPDDGPLTEEQMEQIKESAPKPVEEKVEQVYLSKKWIDKVPGIRFPHQVYKPEEKVEEKPELKKRM